MAADWTWEELKTHLQNLDSSLKLQSILSAPDHAFIGPSLVGLAIEVHETALGTIRELQASRERLSLLELEALKGKEKYRELHRTERARSAKIMQQILSHLNNHTTSPDEALCLIRRDVEDFKGE